MTQEEAAAKWVEMCRNLQQRKDHAARLADAARPVLMQDPRYPHLKWLVGPDMSNPGSWRITAFGNGEPWGHTEHRTAYEAFFDALQRGATPVGG